MGRKLEDIRRLRERITSGQLTGVEAQQERLLVKSRIVGTLLKDARNASARSEADSAAILGMSEAEYRAIEAGTQSPTLPQVEVLAYFFNVPVGHFWKGNTLSVERHEEDIKTRVPEIMMLRQRIIGVQLRRLRERSGLSVEQVAKESGMAAELIQEVEAGQRAASINELETLTITVRASLDDLMDGHGPVGSWLQAQEDFEAFSDLPVEIRAFILRPINRSYLELALRLSEMEVDKLRGIAESILDITL
jgi:transcriptional regulator with XRE-family HTH domain